MVTKMLELSTAHIKESTNQWLEYQSNIVTFCKKGYGWFIFVPDDEIEEYLDGVPEDLKDIIKYAVMKKCNWICLDSDADTIEQLTQYDW